MVNLRQGLERTRRCLHCLQLWHHLAPGVHFPLLVVGPLHYACDLVSRSADFRGSGQRIGLTAKNQKKIDLMDLGQIRAVVA